MRVLRAALDAMERGVPAALITVVGVDGSAPRSTTARMLVYADGGFVGTIGGGEWEHRVVERAQEALQRGHSARFTAHLTRDLGMCCGGAMDAFIEVLDTRPRLHVFGAGHVAHALARHADGLGFALTVYDERDDWLTEDRFPTATRVLGDPRRALPEGSPRDYFLILTHTHQLDQDILELLLPRACAWLGLIGSRNKVARFFLRLRAAGVDEALFRRVSGPVGLDIGAETPEEIAISIAAELIRVRRGHTAPTIAMAEHPLPARGGDGKAVPPALDKTVG